MTDLHADIGSNTPVGTLQFTLFIPSVDRDGQQIGQDGWVEQALRTFGALFRGATAFPPGRGVWRDDDRGGTLVFDDTVMVTSYVDPALVTDTTLAQLRAFLHCMGRDARQGEIGIVIDGQYHGVTEYDQPGGS
ncbi:MAG: hypothetical protein JKY65_00780 [Planctomycetes bacterium]|nr:hypothetical protein [Planctomycetota bacterium]